MKKILLSLAFLLSISTMTVLGQDASISRVENEIEKRNYKVDIFPVPATDYITIRLEDNSFDAVEFEIFSLIGNKVEFSTQKISDSEYKIPVRDYAAGQYILVIKDNNARYRRAFKFQKVIR